MFPRPHGDVVHLSVNHQPFVILGGVFLYLLPRVHAGGTVSGTLSTLAHPSTLSVIQSERTVNNSQNVSCEWVSTAFSENYRSDCNNNIS